MMFCPGTTVQEPGYIKAKAKKEKANARCKLGLGRSSKYSWENQISINLDVLKIETHRKATAYKFMHLCPRQQFVERSMGYEEVCRRGTCWKGDLG